MKTSRNPSQRGAVLPLIAVSLTLMFVSMALAIDLGWIVLGKNQLQNTADAAALAGVVELMEVGLEPTENSFTWAPARDVAFDYAEFNRVSGKDPIQLDLDSEEEVVTGWIAKWWEQPDPNDPDTLLDTGADFHNSLRVTARLSADLNGPMQMFLGAFTGLDEVELTARATATAENRIGALLGGRVLPIAFMEEWDPDFIEELYPAWLFGPESADYEDCETCQLLYDEDGNLIPDPYDLGFWGNGWKDQFPDYVANETPLALSQIHQAEKPDANFDWIFFDDSYNESPGTQNDKLWDWIINGVDFIEILDEGQLEIGKEFTGNAAGIRTTLIAEMPQVYGDLLILLLFDAVTRINDTLLEYRISKWVGIEVVGLQEKGQGQGKGKGQGQQGGAMHTNILIKPAAVNGTGIAAEIGTGPMGNIYVLSLTR